MPLLTSSNYGHRVTTTVLSEPFNRSQVRVDHVQTGFSYRRETGLPPFREQTGGTCSLGSWNKYRCPAGADPGLLERGSFQIDKGVLFRWFYVIYFWIYSWKGWIIFTQRGFEQTNSGSAGGPTFSYLKSQSHVLRKPAYVKCEQQRHISACAFDVAV